MRILRRVVMAVGIAFLNSAHAAPTAWKAPAHSQVPKAAEKSVSVGRLPASKTLDVTVVLPVRDLSGLESLITRQANPRSADFMRYLTPAQYGARFGAAEADVQAVKDYLAENGLTVTRTCPNQTVVQARGKVEKVEKAFHVELKRYRVDGRDVFANDTSPQLPDALNVLYVGGLSNIQTLSPRDGGAPPYTPSAINTAYNLAALRAAGYDGTGQTIAVYSLADFSDANVAAWAAQVLSYASPPSTDAFSTSNISRVSVDNSDGSFGTYSYDAEADLDVELCLGAVPGARIQVWEAANGTAGVFNMFNQFATQTDVKIMSSSWGTAERNFLPGDTAELDAYHQIFQQAAAEGLTIFNSSGDLGADEPVYGEEMGPAVSHPAGDPYVAAIGGTSLATSSTNGYVSETGWGGANPEGSNFPYFGSGGGLSLYFLKPAWQAGPGVANAASTGYRQVPDVSLNADSATGYLAYLTNNAVTGFLSAGGTSAAAPVWAGGALLLQQALGRSFFLPPLLYHIFAAGNGGPPFHDILSGTNGLYNAGPGWDYVTGIGSVDFGALKSALQALLGDVNGDGVFDVQDAVASLREAGGLDLVPATQTDPGEPGGGLRGDVDGDGHVTFQDTVLLLRWLNGL